MKRDYIPAGLIVRALVDAAEAHTQAAHAAAMANNPALAETERRIAKAMHDCRRELGAGTVSVRVTTS